jgi:ABC-type transporter Mla subunit MlaD
MITALVIILLFSGGSNGLNLSDPAALAKFNQGVSTIISDPQRAANVSNAVQQLNYMSYQARNPTGMIEKEIQTLSIVAGAYDATPEQVFSAVQNLEFALNRVNQNTVQARETIRQNTTKGEWKKLLKAMSKK